MAIHGIFQGSEGTTEMVAETSESGENLDTVDGCVYPIDQGFSP